MGEGNGCKGEGFRKGVGGRRASVWIRINVEKFGNRMEGYFGGFGRIFFISF